MNVISSNSIARRKLKACALAIGIFDGLHRGHQYLLKRMLRKAKALKAQSLVVTFYPHPAHVLNPQVDLRYLASLEHRLQLLAGLRVDVCLVLRFTKKFATMKPELFIRDLVQRLGARAIFVGEDFRFGKDRSGDVKLFKQLAVEYGYQMCGVKALTDAQGPVSSTRIRQLVSAGDLAAARRLLGRPFSVLGRVVRGSGRGKLLGYPTANLVYNNKGESGRILPPHGVYAVRLIWRGKTYKGAANLGVRPSFKEKSSQLRLEVHILDFHGRLYGEEVEVLFIKSIRQERAFADPAQLAQQIQKDIAVALKLL